MAEIIQPEMALYKPGGRTARELVVAAQASRGAG
jgi:hypothetical protein